MISFILLCLPGSNLPKVGWLENIHFDKIVHICMFGGLVGLWCWPSWVFGWKKQQAVRIFLLIAILATVYGIIMEFVQERYIPNRSFDQGDIVADAIGSFTGYFVARWKMIRN
jgi:VanZ family protein